ncbi:hypothetical protein N476_17095 [Pseudoalteromonas luteoviolacea H33]|uniref:Uncharacterized protein n=1 Tax=Pseudoalteromonas luteoviolacea H33 TaxID=1365251 RepID=A0A167E5B6_9GAMM|nr:hypothetical protein N476_17095 [Pseudoalteromonas luteoviolacea H33]
MVFFRQVRLNVASGITGRKAFKIELKALGLSLL